MTCSCQKLNYLGDHPVPKGHLMLLDFEKNEVSLWATPGYRIGNPVSYLTRYWERRYDMEGYPDDPIPA